MLLCWCAAVLVLLSCACAYLSGHVWCVCVYVGMGGCLCMCTCMYVCLLCNVRCALESVRVCTCVCVCACVCEDVQHMSWLTHAHGTRVSGTAHAMKWHASLTEAHTHRNSTHTTYNSQLNCAHSHTHMDTRTHTLTLMHPCTHA